MPTALPILQPVPIFKNKDYREVLVREMEGGKIPISLGQDLSGEVRVLLRDRPFLPRNARSAQDDRRGLEVHPRLHQQEADRSDAVLVSGRQRIHGMDRSVPPSEGDGMGRGFPDLHGQEHHVLHRRLRPGAQDPRAGGALSRPDQLRAVGDHAERLPPAAHAPCAVGQASDEGLGWPGRVLGELLRVRRAHDVEGRGDDLEDQSEDACCGWAA